MKKFLVALTTAGLLVAGGAGVASAAGSGSGSGSTTPAHHPALEHKLAGQALKIAADKIGVSTADLKAALKSGKSVADVARSKNVDPADVVAALVQAAKTKIDKAVTNGKLSADKAAKLKANLADRATKLVNNTHLNKAYRKAERYGRRVNLVRGAGKIAADTIGVSPQALRTALKGGQSVAGYATSKGVDPQTVINAIVNAGNTKIDQAVTNGKLSAGRAATLKSKLTASVTKLVNAHHGSAQGVNG
jgi:ribosomal protein S20